MSDKHSPKSGRIALIVLITLPILLLIIFGISRIVGCNKENLPPFKVTPAKLCSLGPYTTNGGPHEKLCNKMWSTPTGRKDIAEYTCLNGACSRGSGMTPTEETLKDTYQPGNPWGTGMYTGLPLHFEFSVMSDANFENTMCKPPIVRKDRPQVL